MKLSLGTWTMQGREGGAFENILAHFKDLQVRWPPRGDVLDPKKSILVVSPRNIPRAEEFF